ncbi:MAG: PEP-CTERM sorting domain-containing protein [Planctomycetes bacterium]|nr:PEP-CTERM sorting domain-containing protein [Planctomycetota bacterium]
MKRSIVLLVALLLGATGRAGMAGTITYSWEGRIVPDDVNQDPWDIGAAGKPFFVSVTLDEVPMGPFATDSDPDVDSAQFEASNVAFAIDGESATVFGNDFALGGIAFFDFASRDHISIGLSDVQFNRVIEERFLTSVRLPASTFTFTNEFELPPLFPPTTTITSFGTEGLDSSYVTFTEAGFLVTATRISEGDLTGNGFVDFDDLTILLAHWDQEASAGQGNLVDPLTTPINFQDLTFLLADWTGPGPVAAPDAAVGQEAVPEPSTLLLALLAALGAGITLRRGRIR